MRFVRPWIACSMVMVGAMACTDGPETGDAGDASSGAASTGVESTSTSSGSTTGATAEESTAASAESGSTAGAETTAGETEGSMDPLQVALFACMIDEPCDRDGISSFSCANEPDTCPPPPAWTETDLCRLELAMSAAAGGVTAEMNAEGPNELDYLYDYDTVVLLPDGTAFRQRYEIDESSETTTLYPTRRCVLQPPEWFQACLDVPTWECAYEGRWYVDCLDQVEPECG